MAQAAIREFKQSWKTMRDEIIARQNDPRVLEQMYLINKSAFKREFISLYPKLSARSIAEF
jgi:hypothetical protein